MELEIVFNFAGENLQRYLLPLISAQMLFMALCYFVIIYRGALKSKSLFCLFLVLFILFLLNRFIHITIYSDDGQLWLYARMGGLFGVGIPVLLTALFRQCKTEMLRFYWFIPYILGALIAIIYCISHDISYQANFFPREYKAYFPFTVDRDTHRYTIAIGIFVMLILPCIYLIYRQLNDLRNKITLAFLYGSLSFGLLFFSSMFTFQFHWIYGIGSASLAIFWCYAVYLDIQLTKGKTLLLSEELTLLLKSEIKDIKPELETLLKELEYHSEGNLEHYKLKIREILNLLTDNTISSGADTDSLLKRNLEKILAIKQSTTASEIRKLATDELLALSQMMHEQPEKRSEKIVSAAIHYIQQHFHEQIDIDTLAEKANVSHSYLMRIFKKSTNKTVTQYTNDIRIERAKELLVELSVTDTAFAVGFNDANYFSTVFKKMTGLSPVQFQESQKE